MVTLAPWRNRPMVEDVEAQVPQLPVPATPPDPPACAAAIAVFTRPHYVPGKRPGTQVLAEPGYVLLAHLPADHPYAPGKMAPFVMAPITDDDHSHAVAVRSVTGMGYPSIYVPLTMGPQRERTYAGRLDWWLLQLPSLGELRHVLPHHGFSGVGIYTRGDLRDEILQRPGHFYEPGLLFDMLDWSLDRGL